MCVWRGGAVSHPGISPQEQLYLPQPFPEEFPGAAGTEASELGRPGEASPTPPVPAGGPSTPREQGFAESKAAPQRQITAPETFLQVERTPRGSWEKPCLPALGTGVASMGPTGGKGSVHGPVGLPPPLPQNIRLSPALLASIPNSVSAPAHAVPS